MPKCKHRPPPCKLQLERIVLKLDLVVPSSVRVIDKAVAGITHLIGASGCPIELERVDLVMREALANAIVHGNRNNPAKSVRICIAIQEDCGLLIIVKDVGEEFDPTHLPNPTKGGNRFKSHGRGIFLIRQLMDEVEFNCDSGTEISMTLGVTKNRSGTHKKGH